jgi:hypothetical protein
MFDPMEEPLDEPMTDEEIDSLAEFSVAVIEQAEDDNLLFEMITQWPKEKVIAYEQAFLMYNIANRMHEMFKRNNDPESKWFEI